MQPGRRIHIALHGCEQSRETIGDTFIRELGFAAIADKNRLIVLFPQTRREHGQPAWLLGLVGHTGLDDLGKDAPQIRAIWAMAVHLASRR